MRNWLLLTQDYPPDFIGGISAWAHDLANALHQAGEPVTVLARNTENAADFDADEPTRNIRMRGRSWGRWQGVWAAWSARKHVGEDTVIIAATWGMATRLRPLVQRSGARLLVAAHGSELTTLDEAPPALLAVNEFCDCWLPVSHFLAGELRRLMEPGGVRVLPMPLQTDPPTTTHSTDALICVARPTERKGIDRAIRLAALLGRPLELIGPTSPNSPQVYAHGPLSREAARAKVASAAACVLLPRTDERGRGAEGLGLSLLEAASLGVPVIGCDTGGVNEAVGPGLLLADPDAPDGDLVDRWLADPHQGQKALDWVRAHHGPSATLQVLQEVIA